MSAVLGAAIVGAGAAARELHAPAWAACEGVELVGIASRRPDAAAAIASAYAGARAFASVDALLEDEAVDIVTICTPPDTHRELAERAVAAGKHVLVEKPIAHTLEDTAALRALAESAPTVVEVVRNERYMALHRAAREAVAAGAIGSLTGGLLFTATTGPDDWTGGAAWPRQLARAGGGVLLDLGVHRLDLVGWLTERQIVAVTPTLRRAPGPLDGEVEWAGALSLMLEGGVPVSLVASWAGPPDAMLVLLGGSEGTLQADGVTGSLTIAREGRVETSQHPLPWGPDDDSALAMAAAFAAACRGERQPESTGWDAATRWLLEAYRLAGAEP